MAEPRKWRSREKHTLFYPKHRFQPEDLLGFIEMNGFYDEWIDLGLTDDDLGLFQAVIMTAPKSNKVIPETGGFRVLQMSCDGERNLSIRLGYVYFEDHGIVLLVIARNDDALDHFSEPGRRSIRRLIEREAELLSLGPIR